MQAVKTNLGLTPVMTQWLIVAYSIIASALILIAGQFGDIYGHFKTLLFGNSIQLHWVYIIFYWKLRNTCDDSYSFERNKHSTYRSMFYV